jgi:DNA repair exonuclease SbcCD ATPase subunit
MAINPTNDFNALGQLSTARQNRLMTMALNGDSIVSPFADVADREGLSPKGRARKEREREEQRFAREWSARIEEQRERFQRELDRLEQASLAALHENEEQLRAAREELRKIQERAYEITLPDGTVTKVYRDGDKVRTDAGAEVSRDILRAEDLPDGLPLWAERTASGEKNHALDEKHRQILEYREKLERMREVSGGGDPPDESVEQLRAELGAMPEPVTAHYRSLDGPPLQEQANDVSSESRASSMRAFSAAVQRASGDNASPDIRKQRPADVSAPAPG